MQPRHDQSSAAGRTALVLGATSPLGKACARRLSGAGASLLLHGRDRARLSALSASLPGSREIAFGFDGRNTEDFLALLAGFPAPTILAAVLGPFLSAPLAETSTADWERLCALDLALPGALVSSLLPGMRREGYGRILLFGASRGDQGRGFRRTAAYASAKAGLSVLTRSVALEYGKEGVSCTLICPGAIAGGIAPDGKAGAWLPEDPDELAESALALALHPRALFNGAIVAADGGMDLP